MVSILQQKQKTRKDPEKQLEFKMSKESRKLISFSSPNEKIYKNQSV